MSKSKDKDDIAFINMRGEMVVDYISSLEKKSSENLLKKSAQELIEMELVKVSK